VQCAAHLRKGAWVNVQGRLRTDSWLDKDTQVRLAWRR